MKVPGFISYDPHRRGGRGPDLSETTPCAGWLETGSKSSMGKLLIHMDAQVHRIFPETAGLYSWTSANPHAISQRFVQQPLVLIILCIHVQFIVLLD